MLVGSAATGGVAHGDDVDLNLVVADGRKYSTNLLAGLLNRKYSIRYHQATGMKRKDHYLIPPVMCINIIWEESQVAPFIRQDGQVAYEVFTGRVLHGREYHRWMLSANGWLSGYFPQMLKGMRPAGETRDVGGGNNGTRPLERVSRSTLFAFQHLTRLYMSRRPKDIEHMEHWEQLKQPYGLFDRPEMEDELWGVTGR
jgi:hypothetical protein